ncbi:MAG: aminotransferase class V-fold PLP-dependent enzyme [Holosporaceae bacterium]|nr:aminotransferase class V-fold PLP-dependent enzyme [Holosporaceae bacterium]
MFAFLFLCFSAIGMDDVTYLDQAASFEINDPALKKFIDVCLLKGNSSGINPHAKYLFTIEEHATKTIADKVNLPIKGRIVFTNSATISNNIAILGVAYRYPGCHLITSKIEHKSVLNVFKYLESRGYKVTYLDVDKHGVIDPQLVVKHIRKDTKLISIQMLNGEIGTIQNIKEIGAIAATRKILFHSDAAQAFCKYPINLQDMNIDLLTISGYKIGAPKGIAALCVNNPSQITPILFGTGDDFFPGTRPTALIASFAEAVQNFRFNKVDIEAKAQILVNELQKIPAIYINSPKLSYIVSVSIEGVLLKDILDRMKDFSFSAGCSCLGQERSNVLAAIDPNDKLPSCTLRMSFSNTTSSKDLQRFAKLLKEVVEDLRKEKSIGKGCESNKSHHEEYFGKPS